jgi:hypothetical protein
MLQALAQLEPLRVVEALQALAQFESLREVETLQGLGRLGFPSIETVGSVETPTRPKQTGQRTGLKSG